MAVFRRIRRRRDHRVFDLQRSIFADQDPVVDTCRSEMYRSLCFRYAQLAQCYQSALDGGGDLLCIQVVRDVGHDVNETSQQCPCPFLTAMLS
jgi:hypothetical protein